MKKSLLLILLCILHTSAMSNPKREMRATWLTTVANIDWPLSYTVGEEAQKNELNALLDACVKFNMNTVLF
ncbi:MAG: hypothetical protein IJ989_04525, partial [Paludibacteraceae bacterium]|nr:hypothetical protein [Paludibacteraceae bacterium]